MLYDVIYTAVNDIVFANTLSATGEIACTLISAILTIFALSLPFLVVYKLIQIVMGY